MAKNRPTNRMDILVDALSALTNANNLLQDIDARTLRGDEVRRTGLREARNCTASAIAETRALINAEMQSLRPTG